MKLGYNAFVEITETAETAESLIEEANEISDKILLLAGRVEPEKRRIFFDTNEQSAKYDLALRAAAPKLGFTPKISLIGEIDRGDSNSIGVVEVCLSVKNPITGKVDPYASLFLPKGDNRRFIDNSAVCWKLSSTEMSFEDHAMKKPEYASIFTAHFFPSLRAAHRMVKLFYGN